MLGIILGILKFIGIALLSVLCLFLVILLIVLFVPVRYKASGYYRDKKYDLNAKVTYLLHIVSAKVSFDGKFNLSVKIFGFELISKNKKKQKQKKISTKKNISESNETNNTVGITEVKNSEVSNEDTDVKEKATEAKDNKEDIKISVVEKEKATESEVDEEEATKSEVDKEENKAEANIKPEIEESNTVEKTDSSDKTECKDETKSKKDQILYYVEVLKSEETKAAFSTCTVRIGKAIKSILPRKGKVYIEFGMENAGLIGEIFGIYEALFPFIGHVVTFVPVFTEKQIEADINFKGKIRAASILYQLVRIYLNKNCRKLIKLFIKKK